MKNKAHLVKKYVCKNLSRYGTSKKDIKKTVRQLIKDIEEINLDDSPDQAIEEIGNLIEACRIKLHEDGAKSHRLSFLIAGLYTQVSHLEELEESGLSDIVTKEIENPEHKSRSKALKELNFEEGDQLTLITVSGGGYNPYGHVLLKIGDKGYLEINTLYAKPRFLSAEEMTASLRSSKTVMGIQQIDIKDPRVTEKAISYLSNKKWFWRVSHHNCLSFAQEVALLSGASVNDIQANKNTIRTPIRFFINPDFSVGHIGNSNQINIKKSVHYGLGLKCFRETSDKEKYAEIYANLREGMDITSKEAIEAICKVYDVECSFRPRSIQQNITRGTKYNFDNAKSVAKVTKQIASNAGSRFHWTRHKVTFFRNPPEIDATKNDAALDICSVQAISVK